MSNILIRGKNSISPEVKGILQSDLKLAVSNNVEAISDNPISVILGENLGSNNLTWKYPGGLGGGGWYQNDPNLPIIEVDTNGTVFIPSLGPTPIDTQHIKVDTIDSFSTGYVEGLVPFVFDGQVKVQSSGINVIDTPFAQFHMQSSAIALQIIEADCLGVNPSPGILGITCNGGRCEVPIYALQDGTAHYDLFTDAASQATASINFGIGQNNPPYDIPGQLPMALIPAAALFNCTLLKNNSFVDLDLNSNNIANANDVNLNSISGVNILIDTNVDFNNHTLSNVGGLNMTGDINLASHAILNGVLIESDLYQLTNSSNQTTFMGKTGQSFSANTPVVITSYTSIGAGLPGMDQPSGTFTAPSSGDYVLQFNTYVTGLVGSSDAYARFRNLDGSFTYATTALFFNSLMTDSPAVFGGCKCPSYVTLAAGDVVALEIVFVGAATANITFIATRIFEIV